MSIPSHVTSHVTSRSETLEKKNWQPRVVAFLCNRCASIGDNPAGMSRLLSDNRIEVIRVPCSGRVDPIFLLKCFEKGADGVLVSACSPGACHHALGNYHARKRFAVFQKLLEFCGLDGRRIHFPWDLSDAGVQLPGLIDRVVSQVREAGPLPDIRSRGGNRS
ncbi:MAG: hydrogenase iron-sulfur subunit [bacterium]